MENVTHLPGSFDKELKRTLKSPPDHSVTWKITPDMAQTILDLCNKDAGNRPIRRHRVRKYGRAMADGKWVLTKVPIIFSKSNRLLDGQHRLMACVDAGATFHSTVEFNAPDIAFATVDTGANRGRTDIFAIKGEQNFVVLSGAAAFVWRYENDRLGQRKGGSRDILEPLELWEYMNEHHGALRDAVKHTFEFKRNGFRNGHYIYAALCHLCSLTFPEGAYKFFEQVATGSHHFKWGARHPVFQLRKFLLHDEIARARGEHVEDNRKAAYIVLAWNAWRKSESIASFKWRTVENPAEDFPEIQ